MTTRISTDIVPSLRQHMINEALDYHQNMNSVVFARTAQSVAFNNNPSGKTDPSQGDIVSNAEIKKRISEIAQSIQKLNQTISYAAGSDPTPPPVTTASIGVGNGRVGGRKGKSKTPLWQQEMEEEKYPAEEEKESKEGEPRQPLPFRPAPAAMQRRRRDTARANADTEAIAALEERYNALGVPERPPTRPPKRFTQLGYPDVGGPSDTPIQGKTIPQDRFRTAEYLSNPGAAAARFGKYTHGDYQASRGMLPDGGPPDEPAGPPSGFTPFNPLRPLEIKPFSRPDTHSPKVSNKIQVLIDNTLASIVASYNSLIVYIDSLISQRTFKQREESETTAALKELINPLKLIIANAATLANDKDVTNQQAYSRIYNIIESIINRINSAPPFLKIDTGLLTEPIPLRRDIIAASNFDPEKALNHTYLKSLMDRLDDAQDKQLKTSPKSPIEKEARDLKISQITALRGELTKAGYKTSAEHADIIARRLQDVEESILHTALQPHEEAAVDKYYYLDAEQPAAESEEAYLKRDVEDALEQDIEGVNSSIKETNTEIRDTSQKLKGLAVERRAAENFEFGIENSILVLNRIDDVASTLSRVQSEEATRSTARNRRHINRLSDRLEQLQGDLQNTPYKNFQEVETAQQLLADYYEDTAARKEQYETELSNLKVRKVSLGQERTAMKERALQASKAYAPAYKRKEAIIKEIKPLSAAVPSYMARAQETEQLEAKRKDIGERLDFHRRQAYPVSKKDIETAIKAKRRPRGSGRVGGHVHKASADPFGDNNKLEPYLTKYLRPSKFRNEVPAIESSSDESSDGENDEPQQVPRPAGGTKSLKTQRVGGKKAKKAVEDWEIIESSIHPDKAVLVEKKLKSKRIGSGKKLETTKPAHTMRAEQDLWFM